MEFKKLRIPRKKKKLFKKGGYLAKLTTCKGQVYIDSLGALWL